MREVVTSASRRPFVQIIPEWIAKDEPVFNEDGEQESRDVPLGQVRWDRPNDVEAAKNFTAGVLGGILTRSPLAALLEGLVEALLVDTRRGTQIYQQEFLYSRRWEYRVIVIRDGVPDDDGRLVFSSPDVTPVWKPADNGYGSWPEGVVEWCFPKCE